MREHELLDLVERGKQRMRRLAAQRRLRRGGQIVEDMPVRSHKRHHHPHRRLQAIGALRAVGPGAARPSKHAWMNGQFGDLVGHLCPCIAPERPQWRAPFDHFPTDPVIFGHLARLAGFPRRYLPAVPIESISSSSSQTAIASALK